MVEEASLRSLKDPASDRRANSIKATQAFMTSDVKGTNPQSTLISRATARAETLNTYKPMLGGVTFIVGRRPRMRIYQVVTPFPKSMNRNSIIGPMSVTSNAAKKGNQEWHASLWHTLTLRSYCWIRSATLRLVTPNRGTPFAKSFIWKG